MTRAARIAAIDKAVDDPQRIVAHVLDFALWRAEVEDEAVRFGLAAMRLHEVTS